VQDPLLELAVDTHVVDDEQVGSGTVGLRTNGTPLSLSRTSRIRIPGVTYGESDLA
jgi:hypothetical protein